MRKLLLALSIGILAVLAVQGSSRAQGAATSRLKAPDNQFVVLSPWADVDPIPVRGISPRILTLTGKKIGLFVNPKRASMPIAESIDRLVIGEDEEASPWEPLSVERGFKKEDNTVTVFFPNTFIQTVPGGTDAKGILDTLSGMVSTTMSSVILIPSWAKVLSNEGWTKQKVREYLAAHLTLGSSSTTGLPAGSGPPKVDLNSSLMIVVAGGPGSFIALLRSAGPGFFENELVTQKIELPKNWDKLVAKYKDIKPNYEAY
jgi:hypothetical protein